MAAVGWLHPLVLAFAGLVFLVSASPGLLRLRSGRGVGAIRRPWLLAIGGGLLLAALVSALL